MKPHLVICSSSRECGECIKPYTKKDCFHSIPSKKRMETDAERAMRTPESFDLLEYFGMLVKLHGIIWNSIKNTHEVTSKLLYQNWLHPCVTIAMEILHQESAAMPRWRTCRGTQMRRRNTTGSYWVPTGLSGIFCLVSQSNRFQFHIGD